MAGRLDSILQAKYQFLATSSVLLLVLNLGIVMGWTTAVIPLLTSDESPLPTGKLSMDEISWIASIASIGGLVGNFTYGFVISWLGRKWATIAISVPLLGSWFLIAFAQNVYYLYIARFIEGIGSIAILMTVPVYLVEIANDDVRGILSSVGPVGSSVGTVLAYAMGTYFNYLSTPILAIITTTIFVFTFSLLPNTPIFLVRQNRIEEAENSLRFYKRIPKKDDAYMQSEIDKLKNAIEESESKRNNGIPLQWSDFTTSAGKRAMIIATVLVLVNPFGGVPGMLTYSSAIFKISGSTFSPNASTLIIGIVRLLGTFVITPLIDTAGRRFLYITSCLGTATSQIILGVYMKLHYDQIDVEAYNWIPIVAFSCALFFAAFAVEGLPLSVIAEIMPEKIRNFGMVYAMAVGVAASFIVIKYLPTLASFIELFGCMFFFASVCLLCALFIIVYLPETKGKSYEEIMNSAK